MTLANYITLTRLFLIPVFVLFAVYYGRSVNEGQPIEWLRWVAIGVFLVASVTDALDGLCARARNERSRLGAILDPIADKGLLLTAIITLSLSQWKYALPVWFVIVVVARDLMIAIGCCVLRYLADCSEVKPSWLGKIATVTQMITIAWIMLQFPIYQIPVYVAAVFTLASGIGYLLRGMRRLWSAEFGVWNRGR